MCDGPEIIDLGLATSHLHPYKTLEHKHGINSWPVFTPKTIHHIPSLDSKSHFSNFPKVRWCLHFQMEFAETWGTMACSNSANPIFFKCSESEDLSHFSNGTCFQWDFNRRSSLKMPHDLLFQGHFLIIPSPVHIQHHHFMIPKKCGHSLHPPWFRSWGCLVLGGSSHLVSGLYHQI